MKHINIKTCSSSLFTLRFGLPAKWFYTQFQYQRAGTWVFARPSSFPQQLCMVRIFGHATQLAMQRLALADAGQWTSERTIKNYTSKERNSSLFKKYIVSSSLRRHQGNKHKHNSITKLTFSPHYNKLIIWSFPRNSNGLNEL